jgi:phosphatidylserine/phosphatidylglycerophosphate/cardiolipin synthase-like enzyme
MGGDTILQEGETCWRKGRADALAFLVDGADYFSAVKAAILGAKRSIWLLAWTFDALTRLQPDKIERSGDPETADRLGLLLRRVSALNPGIDIRILCWDMPPPIAAPGGFQGQRAAAYFVGSKIKFKLDSSLPMSACHHQKVLVVDGKLAFVSGGDLSTDRWDTCDHGDHDPRRRLPNMHRYPARHDIAVMMEGPIARDCGQLFVDRWENCSGETLDVPEPDYSEESPWPKGVIPDLLGEQVALVRTSPQWKHHPNIDEGLHLHLRAIAAARTTIYIENQYLASPTIVEALRRRLAEADGPEIVVIGPASSPSFFDRMTMDSARAAAIGRLEADDVNDNFRAYCARTRRDQPIIVHSKVMIVDDFFLRIGSANLNNRSGGLDTECDIAIEAAPGEAGAETRETIITFRNLLIGHYLDRSLPEVEAALERVGRIAGAVAYLDHEPPRLRPVDHRTLGPVERFVNAWSLGDPISPQDAWRPWRRRKCLREQLKLIDRAEEALIPPPTESPAPPPAEGDPTPPAPSYRRAIPRR